MRLLLQVARVNAVLSRRIHTRWLQHRLGQHLYEAMRDSFAEVALQIVCTAEDIADAGPRLRCAQGHRAFDAGEFGYADRTGGDAIIPVAFLIRLSDI
ncbi:MULTISPECIES: hypothetical protein [unclassified Haematobacter]|uniref:hypothetical protein n=1 Tax=unclassified Haematobacter TaxID=2640585 RepID=UPI0025C456A9|nr:MULTISPECIES: hypothetical protein [unclassified Haematobacter]